MTLAVGLGVLAASIPASGSADAWRDLSARQLAPWPGLQEPAGSFPSRTDGREDSTYGEAVVGYALIQRGLRERDGRALRAGMRAIDHAVGVPSATGAAPSVFAVFAIAAAYNALRSGSPADFAEVRRRWSGWARGVRRLRIGRTRYSNKYVVEAAAILELLRTGLRSSDPTALLGRRSQARRLAFDVLTRRVPAEARNGAALLSDPPDYPLAYHALSLAMYARAAQLLGRGAPAAVPRVLVRAALASWRLSAPDGDLAYFGRSQEQVWTLPATAYGALRAAAYAPRYAQRLVAVAERAVARMGELYPVGPGGQYSIPVLREGAAGVPALDPYASGVPYAGLAAVFLNWAIEQPARTLPPSARRRLAADADGFGAVLSRGSGRFAVVRDADVWFAVRAGRSRVYRGDYRSDFGLIALKRFAAGRWRDGLPLRPRTESSTAVSAGPALASDDALPSGRALQVSADGTVAVRGGFYRRDGSRVRGASFRYRPEGACVVMTVGVRRGETLSVGAFFAANPRVTGRVIEDGRSRLELDRPFSTRRSGPYRSATEADITLVSGRLRVRASGTLRAKHC